MARDAVNRVIHAERLQIHDETKGWYKFKALCSNSLHAFREFRIVGLKDALRFLYRYFFWRCLQMDTNSLVWKTRSNRRFVANTARPTMTRLLQ